MGKYMRWVVFLLYFWLALGYQARAQHTHEGEVGEFYKTWKQPDLFLGLRIASCCGNADCRPILAFRKSQNPYATWEVEVQDLNERQTQWYMVPNRIWEDAQNDPRESPDGRGHACINQGRVICAVRASGQ